MILITDFPVLTKASCLIEILPSERADISGCWLIDTGVFVFIEVLIFFTNRPSFAQLSLVVVKGVSNGADLD